MVIPTVTEDDVLNDEFTTKVVTHYEGFFSHVYKCPAGKWTIGYGHLCRPNHEPINKDEALELLKRDMSDAYGDVYALCGKYLANEPVYRWAALCSWVFNLGGDNLSNSTLLKRIREKDWDAAADEMLRWDKCHTENDGVVTLAGLTKRRKSESDYFRDGTLHIY